VPVEIAQGLDPAVACVDFSGCICCCLLVANAWKFLERRNSTKCRDIVSVMACQKWGTAVKCFKWSQYQWWYCVVFWTKCIHIAIYFIAIYFTLLYIFSEMTYYVSSGTLNSTNSTQLCYISFNVRWLSQSDKLKLVQWVNNLYIISSISYCIAAEQRHEVFESCTFLLIDSWLWSVVLLIKMQTTTNALEYTTYTSVSNKSVKLTG